MHLDMIKVKTYCRQLTLKVNSSFISRRFQNVITMEEKLSIFKGMRKPGEKFMSLRFVDVNCNPT